MILSGTLFIIVFIVKKTVDSVQAVTTGSVRSYIIWDLQCRTSLRKQSLDRKLCREQLVICREKFDQPFVLIITNHN